MDKDILTARNTVPVAKFNSHRWQRDIQEARCLLQAGANLPRHLWAAWIAEQTGIHCHAFSITKTHYGEGWEWHGGIQALMYFSVAEIASSENVWFARMGRELMLKAILRLDSESARETALEATQGCFHGSDSPVQERVAEAIRLFEMPADRKANVREKRIEIPGDPVLMTEPPEVFAAELARLRLVEGGLSSEQMVDSFYEG